MKIVLIRHGLSEANKKRVISGLMDVDLSEEGIEYLKELKKSTNYPETDYYVATGLKRTVQTFNILFEGKEIDKIEERFNEIDFGDYENISFDSIDMDDYFLRIYKNENISNNELISDFYNRLENGLIDLVNELKDKNLNSATIVAHSTVIRILAVKATDDSLENFRVTRPKNGLGFILDVDVVDGKLIYNSCTSI